MLGFVVKVLHLFVSHSVYMLKTFPCEHYLSTLGIHSFVPTLFKERGIQIFRIGK